MRQHTKVILFGWVLAMVPTFIALIPFSILWWVFQGPSIWAPTLQGLPERLVWLPVYAVCWIVTYKGLEVIADYLLREHRDGLEAVGTWLDRWYW